MLKSNFRSVIHLNCGRCLEHIYLSSNFLISSNMSLLFEPRIVFGLLVLGAFYSFPTEARFNIFSKKSSLNNFQQQQHQQLAIRQTLNLHRQQPLHVLQSSSMESVNLKSHSSALSSSSSNIYRSASSPTLNNANSPALMQETSSLHRQAALSLNMRRANVQRGNSMLQRLKPNPARLNSMARYAKNSAIGVAGAGGIASIVNALSNNIERKQIEDLANELNATTTTTTTTTTTAAPELSNPLGVDK